MTKYKGKTMTTLKNAQTKTTINRVTSVVCALLFLCLSTISYAASAQVEKRAPYPSYPNIEVSTNMGKFYLSLDDNRAPITTKNFLDYITEEQYNNTIFHRVIADFVAQGGGFDENFNELPTRSEIFNESGNGLSNLKGTIAMARHFEPHSATAQFYINLVDNQKLDPRPDRWGYTVFGEVVTGMHILQELAQRPTGPGGDFEKDVPIKPFIVLGMRIMAADEEVPVDKVEIFEPETKELAIEYREDSSEDTAKDSAEKPLSEKAKEQVESAKAKIIKKKEETTQ